MNNPIGILDSGVGGLSVWEAIVQELPQESTLYIADSKNCPYGVKNKDTILQLSRRLIQFLLAKNVKLIVIACNTISVLCLDELRKEFPQVPLIGIVPVIKTAAHVTKNKKIGILSTSATAKSEYQQNLIQEFAKGCRVITVGTDSLVPFVERGEIDSSQLEAVLVGELAPFIKADVDTLALGCSHFPFLEKSITRVLGDSVTLLDSSAAVARHVKKILGVRQELQNSKTVSYAFFTTGDNAHIIKSLLGGTIAEDSVVKVEL